MVKEIFSIILLVVGFLFLGKGAVSQTNSPASMRDRIIRAEKPNVTDDDEDRPALQVIELSVGNRAVELNSIFSADNNWLKDLRVRVRNISGKNLYCVGISFGLLAETDTKLETHESWPWGLGLYKGNCGLKGAVGSQTKFRLKPGEETDLEYSAIPQIYRMSMDRMGSLAKAIFHPNARVKFNEKKVVEIPLVFSKLAKFLEDDPY